MAEGYAKSWETLKVVIVMDIVYRLPGGEQTDRDSQSVEVA